MEGIGDSAIVRRGLAIIAALLVLAVLAFIFLAIRIEAVPDAGRPSIIVAAIGLMGVIFTGCLTGLGILLKDSLDRRAQVVAKEAEARLRAETSLRAIELMTAKDLEPIIAGERREGAIIALSSLGYHRLILRLCERFWKENSLSADLVMTVVDECLGSGDRQLQSAAADLLRENHELLAQSPRELNFPSSYYIGWKAGLPSGAKHNLLEALTKGILSKPFDYWEHYIPNQFAYSLYRMILIDEDERFRITASLFALRLCRFMEKRGKNSGFLPPDRGAITFEEIKDTASLVLGISKTLGYPSEQELRSALDKKAGVSDYELSLKIDNWDSPVTATARSEAVDSPSDGSERG